MRLSQLLALPLPHRDGVLTPAPKQPALLAAELLKQPPPPAIKGVDGDSKRCVRAFESLVGGALDEAGQRVLEAAEEGDGEEPGSEGGGSEDAAAPHAGAVYASPWVSGAQRRWRVISSRAFGAWGLATLPAAR